MRTKFHPEATEELAESAHWYSLRSERAAREFLLAVNVTIAAIEQSPERFARMDGRHRAARVANFPFQVMYRHKSEVVEIVAVAHVKRRPKYWRQR